MDALQLPRSVRKSLKIGKCYSHPPFSLFSTPQSQNTLCSKNSLAQYFIHRPTSRLQPLKVAIALHAPVFLSRQTTSLILPANQWSPTASLTSSIHRLRSCTHRFKPKRSSSSSRCLS